ncbi:MAG TPA: AAA family ATPase [Rickettsiales bacterium]|nr:AAA family ATPase [Rickettsiales bacterium]
MKNKKESGEPDITVSAKEVFGLSTDMKVPAYSTADSHVPEIDPAYRFNEEVTRAILAGFMHNRKVLVQGFHGTGKSTHIEQVAARLNWQCIRVNLDSHVTRVDLIGKDAIILQEGKQITAFQEGILPWSLQRPVALVLDEYDAARPDVMFVIQRVLEAQGKLTLLDQNRVITPHPYFRIFATTNTVGLGDTSGLYHGTQPINQGQMDRWNIIATLNYLPEEEEIAIVLAKSPTYNNAKGKALIKSMVAMAGMTREGFKAGDISVVMSPRTVISWAENARIFDNVDTAFRMTFMNKCDETEKPVIAEYYQRCFNVELMGEVA